MSSPVEGSNGRGVTLDGASGRVIASRWQPAPTVYSEALWFKTTTTQGGALAAYGDVRQRAEQRSGSPDVGHAERPD